MFKLVKFILGLALLGVFVWFALTVPLGKHTLYGHVRRIWQAEETRDLVEGTKESARPAIDRVKRSVTKGYEEATRDP